MLTSLWQFSPARKVMLAWVRAEHQRYEWHKREPGSRGPERTHTSTTVIISEVVTGSTLLTPNTVTDIHISHSGTKERWVGNREVKVQMIIKDFSQISNINFGFELLLSSHYLLSTWGCNTATYVTSYFYPRFHCFRVKWPTADIDPLIMIRHVTNTECELDPGHAWVWGVLISGDEPRPDIRMPQWPYRGMTGVHCVLLGWDTPHSCVWSGHMIPAPPPLPQ